MAVFHWLLVITPLLIAGCHPAVEEDQALRIGLAQMPNSLDPRFATDAASSRVGRLLFQRLVDFDDQLRPVPALASWQQLGERHYRFVLRRHIFPFHDGSAFTAEDVVATYRSVLREGSRSPHRASLGVIERVESTTDGVIDFLLKQSDPLFPGRLTLGILPRGLAQQSKLVNDQLVGNGPFAVADASRPERLLLERRSDRQRVELVRVTDATVRALKLVRGEIDLIQNDLPAELIQWLDEQPGIGVTRSPGTNYSYLGFNLQDPVTGDPRVRKAIALAIDRQAIIDAMFAGAAQPAESLLPPAHWAGGEGIAASAHNPAQARLLVSQFVADGGVAKLTYKTSTDALRVRIASVIAQQLQTVGFEVDIESHEWGTFYGDIKAGRFQLYSLAWVGIKMPDIFRYIFHSGSVPPAGANRGRLQNSRVDALIEQAEVLPLREQGEAYRQIQHELAGLRPYVSLWYEGHTVAARQGVSGYSISVDGNYDGLINVVKRTHVGL